MDKTFTFTVSTQSANIIFAMLAKGPYETVAQVLAELQKQAQEQSDKPE